MEEKRSLGAKIFMTITVIIGLILLWFGSCFGLGLIAITSNRVIYLFMYPLAFILPTILIVWLFVKFIKNLNKKAEQQAVLP